MLSSSGAAGQAKSMALKATGSLAAQFRHLKIIMLVVRKFWQVTCCQFKYRQDADETKEPASGNSEGGKASGGQSDAEDQR